VSHARGWLRIEALRVLLRNTRSRNLAVPNGYYSNLVGAPYSGKVFRTSQKFDDIYVVAQAYTIEGGVVFPVMNDAHPWAYEGMSLKDFEARTKRAIEKNVDRN
jgi:hypothetical protein